MSVPNVANGTTGLANAVFPVKPFNTVFAISKRAGSTIEFGPMTAFIGVTFVVLIGTSLSLFDCQLCGVRAHSTCASTELLRQILCYREKIVFVARSCNI